MDGEGEEGSSEPVDEAVALNRIFGILRKATGVDFSYYKHSTLKRRIGRRSRAEKSGAPSSEALVACLDGRGHVGLARDGDAQKSGEKEDAREHHPLEDEQVDREEAPASTSHNEAALTQPGPDA